MSRVLLMREGADQAEAHARRVGKKCECRTNVGSISFTQNSPVPSSRKKSTLKKSVPAATVWATEHIFSHVRGGADFFVSSSDTFFGLLLPSGWFPPPPLPAYMRAMRAASRLSRWLITRRVVLCLDSFALYIMSCFPEESLGRYDTAATGLPNTQVMRISDPCATYQ